MLATIDGQGVTSIPKRRQSFYQRIRNRMSDADYNAIMDKLEQVLDNVSSGDEVVTSSFVPGNNWSNTVYDSIYIACGPEVEPEKYAGWMFGLLMWEAVINHNDLWLFIKSETDDGEPLGTTYFKPKPQ